MGDYAEINELAQSLVGDNILDASLDAGEDLSSPTISGSVSLPEILVELENLGGSDSDQSDLYKRVLETANKCDNLDESKIKDFSFKSTRGILSRERNNIYRLLDATDEAIEACDAYIASRGKSKFFFFKGPITPMGKKRYNTVVKARMCFKAINARCEVYEAMMEKNRQDDEGQKEKFGTQIRRVISMRQKMLAITSRHPEMRDRLENARDNMIENPEEYDGYTFCNIADAVFQNIFYLNPGNENINTSTLLLGYYQAGGENGIKSILDKMDNPNPDGQIIRKVMRQKLGASDETIRNVVTNILTNFVDFMKIFSANWGREMSPDQLRKMSKSLFLVRGFVRAYGITALWKQTGERKDASDYNVRDEIALFDEEPDDSDFSSSIFENVFTTTVESEDSDASESFETTTVETESGDYSEDGGTYTTSSDEEESIFDDDSDDEQEATFVESLRF